MKEKNIKFGPKPLSPYTAEIEKFIKEIYLTLSEKDRRAYAAREALKLPRGGKRLVTLLNVDMRGYSRMSKKLQSEDVVVVLNYFFMAMGSAILKHNGILDKYLGDGILAVFGAPLESTNSALCGKKLKMWMLLPGKNPTQFWSANRPTQK
jgi:class 3 adenylate cyclase